MFEGVEGLANFPLYYVPLKFEGHIDILRRNNSQKSVFGDYHYEIIEIKLAKNLKEHHIMQAAYYNHLIGLIQKYTPQTFYLINGEGIEISFDYEKYTLKLNQILNEISNIWKENITPPPVFGSDCFPWSRYCNEEAIKSKDISIIPSVGGKTREKLIQNGFSTLESIACSDLSELTRIRGIGNKSGSSFKLHAKALIENKIISLKDVNLPKNNTELFIDLEGLTQTLMPEGMEPIDFLFGVVIRQKENLEYQNFIIFDPFDEEECKKKFIGFLKLLNSIPAAPIFHWGFYDQWRIVEQVKMYGVEESLSFIIPRLIDLLQISRSCFAFPLPSRSLKTLAPYLGFNWRIQQMTGLEAIVKYLEYLTDEFRDSTILNDMIAYNEDDLRALVHIKDWMSTYTSH